MSAPPPAPDDEIRLKRSALAWEIRKYRLEARSKAQSEAARLDLDRRRLQFEQEKAKRESSVWSRLAPTFVTSLTAVLGALIGFGGIMYKERVDQQAQKAQNVVESLSDVKPAITDQTAARAKVLANNPPDVAVEVARRMAARSTSTANRLVWQQAIEAAQSEGKGAPANLPTVYVQFREPTKPEAIDAVMTALVKAGYYVPGRQKVTQETNGDVRYFAPPQDTATARRAAAIASTVQQALASSGINLPITPMNRHAAFPKVPSTTFEVWLPPL